MEVLFHCGPGGSWGANYSFQVGEDAVTAERCADFAATHMVS